MNDFTFLTKEQVWGNNQLDIIKKYGTKCAVTDFSILLGCYAVTNINSSEGNALKNRTGWWWTKTPHYCDVDIVTTRGSIGFESAYKQYVGARPVIPYSSIQAMCSNEVRGANGILEVEYGEYPQTVVDEEYSLELEKAFNKGNIPITGKNYTTDSFRYQRFYR